MYGYTLDYVLNNMTLKQVFYFAKEGLAFYGKDVDDKPDIDAFHKAYGSGKVLTR